jgi:hypothetical protein
MSDDLDAVIEQQILMLTSARGASKTICPSEVAQAIDKSEWRRLMKRVRRVAATLAKAGQVAIYRKGKIIDPDEIKGVIRLGLRPEVSNRP